MHDEKHEEFNGLWDEAVPEPGGAVPNRFMWIKCDTMEVMLQNSTAR